MSLQYCADFLHSADPHRFRSTMAAPLAARRVLLPIYALNAEITRAPLVSKEQAVAHMRLKWWYDALEGAVQTQGQPVLDMALPLLTPAGIAALQETITARLWYIYPEPFTDWGALSAHVRSLSLGPLFASFTALGGGVADQAMLREMAQAMGFVHFIRATERGKYLSRDLQNNLHNIRIPKMRNVYTFARRSGPAAAALIEYAGTDAALRFIVQNTDRQDVPKYPFRSAWQRAKLARFCR